MQLPQSKAVTSSEICHRKNQISNCDNNLCDSVSNCTENSDRGFTLVPIESTLLVQTSTNKNDPASKIISRATDLKEDRSSLQKNKPFNDQDQKASLLQDGSSKKTSSQPNNAQPPKRKHKRGHKPVATQPPKLPQLLLPPYPLNQSLIKATRLDSIEQEHYRNILDGKSPLTLVTTSTTARAALPFNGINDDLHVKDIDSGYAWIILAVVFIINASTFGSARAYGLIFDKMSEGDDPNRFKNAALPFTVMGAVENMAGPLTGYLLSLTGSWRLLVFLGSLLITVAHLLAAISGSLSGQLLTMGLMCGLGLSFVTMSFFQVNNAYFVRYRSTAFGIGLAGAAIGAFYITPVCKYFLDNYSVSACYLILSVLLFPNVPLALLLKPKPKEVDPSLDLGIKIIIVSEDDAKQDGCCNSPSNKKKPEVNGEKDETRTADTTPKLVIGSNAGSKQTKEQPTIEVKSRVAEMWLCMGRVLFNPLFHLIWPTQVMFCWLNFVFGIIVVNFGKDRGLDDSMASELVPIWALGQLVGRMIMGTLVDMNFISYRLFTMLCFAVIGSTTWTLNVVRLNNDRYNFLMISLLVFLLSVFISNLYILFNGLVVKYMDPSVQALSIGLSSFIGSFLLLPRANIIGHYRDSVGNYDGLLELLTYASLTGGLIWLVLPQVFKRLCIYKKYKTDP